MAIPKQISEITEQDLVALVAASVREGKTIEYKERIALETDDQKRKFVASIASFANASGGDLIWGVKAENGVPKEIVALKDFDPDRDIRTLRDIIRAHIDPPLFGVEPKEISVRGGMVLVIRVPRAWDGAHMVTYNDDNRFYTRDANGRVLMNVPEIRSSFSAMDSLTARMHRQRFERLSAIRSNELPVTVQDGAKLVLHLFPLLSFDPGFRCDPTVLLQGKDFGPMRVMRGWAPTYDVDGVYVFETSDDGGSPGYSAISRTGCVEVVQCFGRERWIANPDFESQLITFFPTASGWLRTLKIDPPVVAMLSLLDVKDHRLVSGMLRPLYSRPIRQRDLIMHDVFMQTLEVPAAEVLRPFCDSLWQACGLQRSLNFDSSGKWNPHRWD
jgi:hypothetical protein